MATFYGTDIADNVTVTNISDDGYGGNGDDIVRGKSGTNWLFGGAGNDALTGDTPTGTTGTGTIGDPLRYVGPISGDNGDYLEGGNGNDVIYGMSGDDIIYGGRGNESGVVTAASFNFVGGLFGGTGNDYIDGDQGDDYLDGGADNDTLIGGQGIDTMFGGDGADVIYASGFDTAWGGTGNDTMYGELTGEYVVMVGEAGADVLVGGSGGDYLDGGADGDLIFAQVGADTIIGGAGTDTLSGYTGSDVWTGGADLDYFVMNFDIIAGEYEYISDFTDGVDLIGMPAWANGFTNVINSGGNAFLYVNLGFSSWGVVLAGVTAAQVADQIYYFG